MLMLARVAVPRVALPARFAVLLLAWPALFPGGGYASSADPGVGSIEANDWMAYYYLHRKFADTPTTLLTLARDGRLAEPKSQSPLGAFFAQVFRQDPRQAVQWVRAARLDNDSAKPLIYALWMAGNGGAARTLARQHGWPVARIDGLSQAPPDLLKMPLRGPAHIDLMWGAFMGSGDTRYVLRVLDIVLAEPTARDETAQHLRQVASWSLRSNMRQHGRVWQFVLRQVIRREGRERDLLRAIIERFRSERRLPHGEADIGGMLIPNLGGDGTDASPGRDGLPRLNLVRRIARGELFSVEVLVSGMELDQDLNAHVRYDLAIDDPMGEPWLRWDDQVAVKGFVPSGWLVQRARSRINLRMGPQDPVGTYTMAVTLRDLNAGTRFTFKGPLEVVLPSENPRADPLNDFRN
ncbi:MAG: hypothetical protein ACPGU7_12580 [Gammaproteobacteria bacterium]